MRFTDYFEFDPSNSDHDPDSSYIKFNFEYISLSTKYVYNVDFLVEQNRVHISIWVGVEIKSKWRGREIAFDYRPANKEDQLNLQDIFHKCLRKKKMAAYNSVGSKFFDELIDKSVGMEKIFQLSLKAVFS